MKKTIGVIVALFLIIGAVAVVKMKKAAIEKTPAVASYPLPVEAAEAREGSISLSAHYLGTVMPAQYADVSPRITGNLLVVAVREGDRVSKGQLLAAIDDRVLRERESAQSLEIPATEAQLAGAKSVYETQQAVYTRDEMLQKEGAISLEALQRSRAQRDAAVAQVKSLEEKIKALKNVYQAAAFETSYAQISSPLDGIIAKRLQEPGDLAVPGRPVLRVEGLSAFKVVVQIPQVDMSLMKKGSQVTLSDGQGKISAVVSRVYPAVAVGMMGTIEIAMRKRPFGVPSGGSVGVDVTTGKTDRGIIVPLNALLENQKGSFIYTIENSRAKIIFVQVLGKNCEAASVRGDIKNGEMVVLGDEGKLLRIADGMSVAPQKVREGMR
ncbi:MAG TPA: efflux RND transporter periplasmic adaptor subunit [Syntrophales bacterium]|nr:efflux RND transporter periplasmic adaptor subunit [Syntrophales bacterium]